MRLHRLLGERRLSWIRHRCHRQLCRPEFPRADHRGMGGVTPPLGLLAARYAAQACSEARVIKVFCQVSIWLCTAEALRVMGSSPAGPVRARNLPSTSLCSRSATVFTGSNPSVKAKTVFSQFFLEQGPIANCCLCIEPDANALSYSLREERRLKRGMGRRSHHRPKRAAKVSSVGGIFQVPPTPSNPPRLKALVRSTEPSLN